MKWWILIISLIVLLLAGGGTAAYLLLNNDNEEAAETAETDGSGADASDTTETPRKPAIYEAIKPPLIVNFKDESGGIRYLQIGIEIMSRKQAVLDVVKNHMPAIRNNLILLLSEQKPDDLHSRAGKDKLRESVRMAIQEIVQAEAPDLVHAENKEAGKNSSDDNGAVSGTAIEAVYFTKFVMQ